MFVSKKRLKKYMNVIVKEHRKENLGSDYVNLSEKQQIKNVYNQGYEDGTDNFYSEYATFKTAKTVKSTSHTGQPFYSANLFNFIEADNNDGTNELNNATFSSELVFKLLEMYLPTDINKDEVVVYDNFMGTGTTAFVCSKLGINCYGSEIDPAQVEYANNRIMGIKIKNSTKEEEVAEFGLEELF